MAEVSVAGIQQAEDDLDVVEQEAKQAVDLQK